MFECMSPLANELKPRTLRIVSVKTMLGTRIVDLDNDIVDLCMMAWSEADCTLSRTTYQSTGIEIEIETAIETETETVLQCYHSTAHTTTYQSTAPLAVFPEFWVDLCMMAWSEADCTLSRATYQSTAPLAVFPEFWVSALRYHEPVTFLHSEDVISGPWVSLTSLE